MKTYEEMAQSALARGKAIRKERKKTHKIMFGALSGLAVCCLVIIFVFGIGETGPNQNPTNGPNYSTPSNIRFDSIAQIQELFDASEKGQTELTRFLETNITYYGTDFSTQADIEEFRAFLNTALLPCRDVYENDSFTLYYYPGYGLEFFCDVDGIRYCFCVRPYAAWKPDGDEATVVTLDGVSAELREGSYGDSRRLFATFYMGEQVISMWANTTNPDEVNLSGFYWGNLVPTSDSLN
jgi:hypothetical protein